jgi:hypothetical protein
MLDRSGTVTGTVRGTSALDIGLRCQWSVASGLLWLSHEA